MRTYERTHPWINFALDLTKLGHTTWMHLGEAVSKVAHIAGVPLDPNAAERLHAMYLAKGVLATTAIEGNTLTEDEVRDHLQGRLNLPRSRDYLGREIDNIVAACNLISENVIRGDSGAVTPEEIRHYHRLVLTDLPLNGDVVPGELRQHSVVLGRYRAAHFKRAASFRDMVVIRRTHDAGLGPVIPGHVSVMARCPACCQCEEQCNNR